MHWISPHCFIPLVQIRLCTQFCLNHSQLQCCNRGLPPMLRFRVLFGIMVYFMCQLHFFACPKHSRYYTAKCFEFEARQTVCSTSHHHETWYCHWQDRTDCFVLISKRLGSRGFEHSLGQFMRALAAGSVLLTCMWTIFVNATCPWSTCRTAFSLLVAMLQAANLKPGAWKLSWRGLYLYDGWKKQFLTALELLVVTVVTFLGLWILSIL